MHRGTTRSTAIYRRHRSHFLQAFLGAMVFSVVAALGWYAGFYTLLHFLVSCAVVLSLLFSISLVRWIHEFRAETAAPKPPSLRPAQKNGDWISAESLGRSTVEPLTSPAPDKGENFVLASEKIELKPSTKCADPLACFWRWIPASGQFYFSPGLLALLGRSVEVVAPQFSSWEGLCHPEDRAMVVNKLKACAEGLADCCELELRLQKNSGTWTWLKCEVRHVKDLKDPKRAHVTGICLDIQAQKRLEEQLAVYEDLYRTLLESCGVGYARFTVSGNLIDFNQNFLKITGRNAEEMHGVNIEELLTRQSKPAQDKAFHLLKHGAETAHAQVDIVLKDGSSSGVVMHAAMENGEADRKIVWTVFQQPDATSSRTALNPAAQTRSPSEWEDRSRILGKISHEIRTPLNSIVGAADLALGEMKDPAGRHTLQLIRHSAHELFNVFNDFLDVSRLDAGKLKFSDELLDLPYLVDRVVSIFGLHAEEKALSFLTQLGEGVPTSLYGDGERLRQIFMNLIGNAVKFTPREGAVIVQIDFDTDRRKERNEMRQDQIQLHFTVGDTGVGIPRDRLAKIFDPYAEIAPGETTGLGLAVAKRLVEAMGGRIWVDSTPGQGTAFHFTAHFAMPAGESTASGSMTRPMAKHEKLGLRVLLAEDNLVNQRVVTRILEKHGCSVVIAPDGELALEALKTNQTDQPFDLVLMDCEMPNLDGFSATSRIREMEKESNSHLPILALTAHAMEGDRERCLSAGMDEFLAKPLDIDVLLDALRRWGRRRTTGSDLPVEK